MGRPRLKDKIDKVITFKSTETITGALEHYMEDTGLNQSEALRSLVQYGINYYYFVKGFEDIKR